MHCHQKTRLLLFFLSLLLTTGTAAQVVNTEKLRLDVTESGLRGDADLALGLARNKAGQTVSIGLRGRLEYGRARSRWLLLGGYNLTQFNNVDEPGSAPKNFTNTAFGHLRHNYEINAWLTWEAFSQGQWDEIQEIDIRLLNGTGPRFRLAGTDSTHLYFGLLYMYEYEETSEFADRLVFNQDHRLSSYLSGGFRLRDYLTVNHVTYYQPNLSRWSDFRVSSETTLSVSLSEHLSLNTYFQFIYDARPPETVPRVMYVLRNGVGVRF